MSNRFVISGRQQLSGPYPVQGSKNAALPLISAALLSKSIIHLQNVPRIADVNGLLQLVESLDVKTQWEDGTLSLDSRNFRGGDGDGPGIHVVGGYLKEQLLFLAGNSTPDTIPKGM